MSENIIQDAIVSVNEERKSMAASSRAIDRFPRSSVSRGQLRAARALKLAQSDERCNGEDKAGTILSVIGGSYPLMLAFNCNWKAVFVVGRILHCAAGLASSSRMLSINVPALL